MCKSSLIATSLIVLLGSVSTAAAAPLSLDSSQKYVVFRGASAPAQSAASDFHPSIGATLPQSLMLYAFDDRVQSLVPATKEDDYVKMPGNEVLLVHPGSRKVVAIVEQKDAVFGSSHKLVLPAPGGSHS